MVFGVRVSGALPQRGSLCSPNRSFSGDFATIICAHLFHLRIVLSILDSRIGTHFPYLALISAHRASRFALPSGVSR